MHAFLLTYAWLAGFNVVCSIGFLAVRGELPCGSHGERIVSLMVSVALVAWSLCLLQGA